MQHKIRYAQISKDTFFLPYPRQSIRSIVQKSILISVVFIFLAATVSCKPAQVWNMPIDVMVRKLEEGNWEFLRSLDYSKLKPEEAAILGKGAPYYLARVFADLGIEDMEEAMYRVQLKQGADIWSRNASHQLLRFLLQKDREPEVLTVAEQAAGLFPADKVIDRLRLEANYWLKDWNNVLAPRTVTGTGIDLLATMATEYPESLLYRVVALHETGDPRWREVLLYLLTGTKASDLDVRAYQYFTGRETMLQDMPSMEAILLEARSRSVSGESAAASKLYDMILDSGIPGILTRHVLEDATLNYVRSGRQADGIRKIVPLQAALAQPTASTGMVQGLQPAVPLPGDRPLKLVVSESIGRLYRTSNQFTEGASFFLKALSTEQPEADYDRVLWYYLDCLFKSEKPLYLTQLEAFAKTWHSPVYFADILESASVFYVTERDWKSLERLFFAVKKFADDESVSRLAFILSRAMEAGFYPTTAELSVGMLYEEIKTRKKNQYYRFLVSALTRDTSYLFDLPARGGEGEKGIPSSPSLAEDEFVHGFMHFGLYREAYNKARELNDLLSPNLLIILSQELGKRGMFFESINTVYLYLRRPDATVTAEVLFLAYPRGFEEMVQKLVRREALTASLFYALVREESYFDPSIISWAGAVGLSQLMPATAADVAAQLKLESPDLKDPETNLAIGAKYFHTMISKLTKGFQAVAAYNAGPNRVKQWQAQFGDLPDELFAEVIPFQETRSHVRKVLVSSVFYAHLYENKKPWDVIPFMYPEIGANK